MPIPEKYKSWFEEICKECHVPDIAAACEDSGLAIGEIPFLFLDGTLGSEKRIVTHAIMTTLPKHGALQMLRRMLEVQLVMAGPGCPTFGLETSTDTVVMVTPMDPEQLTPKQAALLLQALAQASTVWRDVLQQEGPIKITSHQQKLIQNLKR